jgi:hypothetical protein
MIECVSSHKSRIVVWMNKFCVRNSNSVVYLRLVSFHGIDNGAYRIVADGVDLDIEGLVQETSNQVPDKFAVYT